MAFVGTNFIEAANAAIQHWGGDLRPFQDAMAWKTDYYVSGRYSGKEEVDHKSTATAFPEITGSCPSPTIVEMAAGPSPVSGYPLKAAPAGPPLYRAGNVITD